MCLLMASRPQPQNFTEKIMRKFVGWIASWALYYLSGYVDIVRARLGAKWLSPIYARLLNASNDAQTWGGGRGTWPTW